MSEPQFNDPARYASDLLKDAGILGVSMAKDDAADVDPRALVQRTVQLLAQVAPTGWQTLHAAFSMAGGSEIVQAVAVTADGNVRLPVSTEIVELVRTHRRITVGPQGPWLRLMINCDNSGAAEVSFDYGDSEPPPDQLLPSEAYLRDFQEYPREDAAVWLLAYMGNEGHQTRSAEVAREQAGRQAVAKLADDEIPPLPLLWARIAVLAAVCSGTGAPVGPRCDPATEIYSEDDGGCTLARLPGGRAVLSGGRADSAMLSAAYKGQIGWPDLYHGAPDWVHDMYLDVRAARGLLSFCYWYQDRHWYRAELPESGIAVEDDRSWEPPDDAARAVPAVWSTQEAADLVVTVLKWIGVELSDRNAYAAVDLVAAAEAGVASASYLRRLFPGDVPSAFDVDEALAQLDAAGVLLPDYPTIDAAAAKNLVVEHCRATNFDTRGYPLDELVASRMDGGWMVFVPVPAGEVRIGRTLFLVADDGVIEQASTSMHPTELEIRFAVRFADRVRRRS